MTGGSFWKNRLRGSADPECELHTVAFFLTCTCGLSLAAGGVSG
jgi:hypothetical protein